MCRRIVFGKGSFVSWTILFKSRSQRRATNSTWLKEAMRDIARIYHSLRSTCSQSDLGNEVPLFLVVSLEEDHYSIAKNYRLICCRPRQLRGFLRYEDIIDLEVSLCEHSGLIYGSSILSYRQRLVSWFHFDDDNLLFRFLGDSYLSYSSWS